MQEGDWSIAEIDKSMAASEPEREAAKVAPLVLKEWCQSFALSSKEFTEQNVGAKSLNLSFLQASPLSHLILKCTLLYTCKGRLTSPRFNPVCDAGDVWMS